MLTGRMLVVLDDHDGDGDDEGRSMFRMAGEKEEARRRIGGVPGSAAVSGR